MGKAGEGALKKIIRRLGKLLAIQRARTLLTTALSTLSYHYNC